LVFFLNRLAISDIALLILHSSTGHVVADLGIHVGDISEVEVGHIYVLNLRIWEICLFVCHLFYVHSISFVFTNMFGCGGCQVVPYPQRPVDYSTDFDGTTAPPPQMPNSSNMSNQMHQSMNVGMQQHRVQNPNNLGVNQPVAMHGMNSGGNMYVQRGNATALQQQQQQQQPQQQQGVRRKEQTNVGYPGHYQPPNKSRRM